MTTVAHIPSYEPDLFGDAALTSPYEHYRALRELGPVVRLEAQGKYALPRYAECRAVLADDATYLSSEGVALNEVVNAAMRGGTIGSDGEVHARRRRTVAHRLTPRALRPIKTSVQEQADALVAGLVRQQSFDAVAELAQALPLSVVPEFAGLPLDARGQMLEWASAQFNAMGPMNERCKAALPKSVEMTEYAAAVTASGNVTPGSLADDVVTAAKRGEVTEQEAVRLMLAYIAPSLDTTISAIGSAIWLFASHPDQWQLLRENPSLIPNAVNEVIRLESPIRVVGRRIGTPTSLAGFELMADEQVVILFGSANRDELEWDRADAFDITRDASRQLGFGYGVHGCAGQGLARIEIEALFSSLASHVTRFVLTDEPVRMVNNTIWAFERMPVRIETGEG
jgi:cytochrome P450